MSGESGFGDTTYTPPVDPPPAGFGSPFPEPNPNAAVVRNTGFGSPVDPLLYSFATDETEVGDDGGAKVNIYGPFIRGRVYPVKLLQGALEYSVFNGVNINGFAPFCKVAGLITFYTPALPLGLYDVQVQLEDDYTATLTDALEVKFRYRSPEAYQMKKMFPLAFATGKRAPYKDMGEGHALEGILSAVGSYFTGLSGKPMTHTTSNYVYGGATIAVETTLTFPDVGTLSVGGFKFSYSGRTATTFTGVQALDLNLLTIFEGAEVILNA